MIDQMATLNDDVVETLTRILERARRGEICGLLYAVAKPDGRCDTGISVNAGAEGAFDALRCERTRAHINALLG